MLLNIGVLSKSKSRQNTFHGGEDAETSSEATSRPSLSERTVSDLGELKPIPEKEPGSGWKGVKSHMTSDDRRRRVSSIFGEATQLLQKQERLLRMSVETYIGNIPLIPHVGALCAHFTAHFSNDSNPTSDQPNMPNMSV